MLLQFIWRSICKNNRKMCPNPIFVYFFVGKYHREYKKKEVGRIGALPMALKKLVVLLLSSSARSLFVVLKHIA